MTDRPSEYPEWASNPPTPPPTTITSPNSTERQEGFQPGNPRRGHMNWFMNLVYRFVQWLDQTTRRTSDLHPDQALPVGTPPSLGSGRLITAEDFSARVYADGYEVPLTSFPALGDTFTYNANSDTYWDLGRDGTWTPAVVASAASAPAVTANSVRVYRVRTNASDRTALVDFRVERLRVNQPIQLEEQVYLGPEEYADPADSIPAHTVYRVQSSTPFNGLADIAPLPAGVFAANPGMKSYSVVNVSSGRTGLCLVWGAHLSANTPEWIADDTECTRIDILPDGSAQGIRFFRLTGQTPTAHIVDPDANADSWGVPQALSFECGIKLGTKLNDGVTSAEVNAVPPIDITRGLASEKYSIFDRDITGGTHTFRYFANSGALFSQGSRVLGTNCFYDHANTRWARVSAGPAFVFVEGGGGSSVKVHHASDGGTWADTLTPSTWDELVKIEDGLVTVAGLTSSGGVTAIGDIQSVGEVRGDHFRPTAQTGAFTTGQQYRENMVKAKGTIVLDLTTGPSITIVSSRLFNCTAAESFDGGGKAQIEITFTGGAFGEGTDYAVTYGYFTVGAGLFVPVTTDKTTTTFTIKLATVLGSFNFQGAANISAIGIDFVVV